MMRRRVTTWVRDIRRLPNDKSILSVSRTFKDVNGVIIDDLEYFYDHRSRVIEQYDHFLNERQLSLTYGPKGGNEVLYQNVTATTYNGPRESWFVRDPRNNLVGVTDQFGGIVLSFIYDDFGAAFRILGATAVPFDLFQGRRFDGETGWYSWGARYYDPLTGRFVSPGVAPDDEGNDYTFGRNNPLRPIDADPGLSEL